MSKIKTSIPGMRMLNGDALGVIHFVKKKGELLEIAIVFGDQYLAPFKNIPPFYLKLKPKVPTVGTEEYYETGVDPYEAAEHFVLWYDALGIPGSKRIQLVCHDARVTRETLVEWLGPTTFTNCFSEQMHDVGQMGVFVNTIAEQHSMPYPISHYKLNFMLKQMGVRDSGQYAGIETCLDILELYRRFVGRLRL